MITRLNHVSIFVLNKNSAFEFYVNKLGFKLHTDVPMGPGMRWLTVCAPEQPNLQIKLTAIEDGILFREGTAKQMRELVEKGTCDFGVFECDDLNNK